MKPAPFEYHRPSSVDEAVDALARDGDATVLAGGQSLIPMMNSRLAMPDTVVDISRIDGLEYVEEDGDGVAVGAMTRQAEVENSDLVAERCPLVVEALEVVGHRPIRHRGTIGGNLAHADPTSELPAVSLALDATFTVHGPDGERTVDAEDFFLGYMTTDVGPDEILTEVRFSGMDGAGYAFEETAPRKGDYAIVGVGAVVEASNGTCEDASLAYCAVGENAVRVPEAEDAVVGESLDDGAFAEAGAVAREQLDPPSDVHGTARYRENLIETLTERALERATERTEA